MAGSENDLHRAGQLYVDTAVGGGHHATQERELAQAGSVCAPGEDLFAGRIRALRITAGFEEQRLRLRIENRAPENIASSPIDGVVAASVGGVFGGTEVCPLPQITPQRTDREEPAVL